MNIEYFPDYEQLSNRALAIFLEELEGKRDLFVCASTGASPAGLYTGLVEHYGKDPGIFRDLRIVKLDEWWNLPQEGGPEDQLRKALIEPLQLPDKQYISFISNTLDPEKECFRVQSLLIRKGPIDLSILGLGKNGHIGFNEPGSFLEPHCHLSSLSDSTRSHASVQGLQTKPAYGMTLGIKDILSSKRIILLVAGEGKEEATAELMAGQITTNCPASFLRLHNRVDCLVLDQR